MKKRKELTLIEKLSQAASLIEVAGAKLEVTYYVPEKKSDRNYCENKLNQRWIEFNILLQEVAKLQRDIEGLKIYVSKI